MDARQALDAAQDAPGPAEAVAAEAVPAVELASSAAAGAAASIAIAMDSNGAPAAAGNGPDHSGDRAPALEAPNPVVQIVTETVVLNSNTTWLEIPAFSDAGDPEVAGKRPEIRAVVLLFGWCVVRGAWRRLLPTNNFLSSRSCGTDLRSSRTGSAQRLVSKYRDLYQELLPASSTAIVTHLAAYKAATASHQELNTLFRPVLDTLISYFPELFDLSLPASPDMQKPHLIIHTFSNGGSHQLHHFFRALKLHYPDAKRNLPITSLIVDSAPGSRSVKSFAEFLLASFRMRRTVLALMFCHVVSAIMMAASGISKFVWALVFGRKRLGNRWGVGDDLFDEMWETYGNGPRRTIPALGGSEWTERCGKLLIYSEVSLAGFRWLGFSRI